MAQKENLSGPDSLRACSKLYSTDSWEAVQWVSLEPWSVEAQRVAVLKRQPWARWQPLQSVDSGQKQFLNQPPLTQSSMTPLMSYH